MNQRTKELWLIPTIIALATGIPLGAGFMFLGPWLAGTPIHPSFSLRWVTLALFAPLPVWVTLIVLFVTVIVTVLLLRQRFRTAEEAEQKQSAIQKVAYLENQILKVNQEHAAQIEKLNAKHPRIHGVWNNIQTFWHLGRKGQEPMMQIGGWIDLTSSNTEEEIYLLAAYIDGQRSDIFMDVAVSPSIVNRTQLVLYMVPPLETDATKPFTATVVVEDQYNRKYELPVHTFRATPGQPVPPLPDKKPRPVIHASWRGDSVWGWASSHPEEDPIYMVRGDVTLLMDNIAEPVIITGVEIEGAESMGTFDNFQLTPNQPETRGMRVYFRGKAPKGIDDYTVQLVFKDLRGNRYPTVEHRFKPLSIPERVSIQRGQGSGVE
jgi:membrane protein implicated in regulation of membrane protease activity